VVRIESKQALLSADSLRNFQLLEGDRVHISKDSGIVRLAHLSKTLFSDRLVAKFKLPIQGWRGE
jgi:NAD+ kinase